MWKMRWFWGPAPLSVSLKGLVLKLACKVTWTTHLSILLLTPSLWDPNTLAKLDHSLLPLAQLLHGDSSISLNRVWSRLPLNPTCCILIMIPYFIVYLIYTDSWPLKHKGFNSMGTLILQFFQQIHWKNFGDLWQLEKFIDKPCTLEIDKNPEKVRHAMNA